MKNFCTFLLFLLPFFALGQIYVDENASGYENGSSWEHAFEKLQDAIIAANPGDEIWVAEGQYFPSYERQNILAGYYGGGVSEKSTIFINKDIQIYGGFAGNETQRDQRDSDSYPTILSGNYKRNKNCYHVVYFEDVSSACLLDGFTISDGIANESDDYNNYGAGIFNISINAASSPTIKNCIIQDNEAFYGGGMFNKVDDKNSVPTLINCQFINNIAGEEGGAIFNEAVSGNIELHLTDCNFTSNEAESGGAIYNQGNSGICDGIYDNCLFNFNEATNSGAAIYNLAQANGFTKPQLINCSFQQNTANYGGAIFNRSKDNGQCTPQLTFCSFNTNEAIYHGGAVYNQSVGGISAAEYINCFFKSNLAYLGAGIYTVNSGGTSTPLITNCTFTENAATDLGGALYNSSIVGSCSPQITNCTFSQNSAHNGGAGMYNTQKFGTCTPIVTNSILWDVNPIANHDNAAPTVQFSIIRGTSLATGTTDGGNNLINYDPLFVDEANGDFRLKPCSPAVDNADVNVEQYAEDLDGTSRVVNLLDIGAFEIQVKRVLVDEPSNALTADAEYTDANGWTHYFDCENNILLLSLNKNGQDIGTLGDGSFGVEIVTTDTYSSGKGVDLSAAQYVETGAFSAMNRYWNVYPTTQPTQPVNVRFYYSLDDLQDLKGSSNRVKDITKSFFFKVDNSNNPHELNIPTEDFHEYTYNATTASTTEWTNGNYQGFDYAEYLVNSFSGGGGGTGARSSSLPVELIYFGATVDEEQVVLEWSTATEINTRGFEIQHSDDGLQWDAIKFIRAKGNTTQQQKYVYAHKGIIPGTQYYRLHIIDFDEFAEYSKVQTVQYKNEHFSADVYPNPMPERGTIQFYQTGEPLQAIHIYNMNGQEIHVFRDFEEDDNQLALDTPLSAGMYLVTFETATRKTVKKLVVQKR